VVYWEGLHVNGNGAATVAQQEKRNLSLFNNQKEVADYPGIHYSTVSRMVNEGILGYIRNKTLPLY